MLTIVLDLNAISDLFRHTHNISPEAATDLKYTLRRHVQKGTLRVLSTYTLLDEIIEGYRGNPRECHQIRRELHRLSRGNVLKPTLIRVSREARVKGHLTRRHAFEDKRDAQFVWREMTQHATAEWAGGEIRKLKSKHYAMATSLKTDVIAHCLNVGIPKHRITTDVKKWFVDWKEHVDDWMSVPLRDGSLGIRDREASSHDLRVRDIPSLWNWVSFYFANIFMLHHRGRKVEESGTYDNHLYADAVYADLLVTSDLRFIETAQLLEGNRPQCITLAEFARQLRR
jgi:hypothetical protein